MIEIPELEIQLPLAPEVIETPELENPCAAVEEEEVAPVIPEIEVIVPEGPVVRPLPEEEESVISPEIEVISPEVGACVEEEVVAEAPVASVLPAEPAVDATVLLRPFPAKFE